ncbi:hypothetical protein F4819DRAFT_483302 [Hypoxylon fuscum]|nr:hypothetical protein F4819DRAFT_483302 [Hypoxylon fuscum]
MLELNHLLPQEGMTYHVNRDRDSEREYENKAVNALNRAGFVNTRRDPASEKRNKQAVDLALAHAFTVALRPSIFRKLKTGLQGAARFLLALRRELRWTQRLSKPDWFMFCQNVIAARRAWKRNPRLPLQNSATAKSIDKFLTRAAERWNPGDRIMNTTPGSSFDISNLRAALNDVKAAVDDMEVEAVEVTIFGEEDVDA